MAESPKKFAKLLTQAIFKIKIRKIKSIEAIQDELGYKLGKEGGASIQKWRQGHTLPKLSDLENLACELVKRGGLQNGKELFEFLDSGGHPNPGPLCNELFPSDEEKKPPPPPLLIISPDEFYVERKADTEFEKEIVKPGATIIIYGPRLTGKTSLLIRGMRYAHQQIGAKTAHLQFKVLSDDSLTSYYIFCRQLAAWIFLELGLDVTEVEKMWPNPLPDSTPVPSLDPSLKLTYLIEDKILSQPDLPQIILAMDEVDRLVEKPFHKFFYRLIRSWHEERTRKKQWEKLNIVLVISTEPFLLVDKNDQPSPFYNVTATFELADFHPDQVHKLNQQYGSPVTENEFPDFTETLSGHPYLTRQAFDILARTGQTWANLAPNVATDQGFFREHLRHLDTSLQKKPELGLRGALLEVIDHSYCDNKEALIRLLQAGVVKSRSDGTYECRCGLYRKYFADRPK
jgi:hypothetical protein